MITFEASLSCDRDGCGNGFSSEQKATPQEAQVQVEAMAFDRGWLFVPLWSSGDWICPSCEQETKRAQPIGRARDGI